MVEWVGHNASTLLLNELVCTGTTGTLVNNILKKYEEPAILGPGFSRAFIRKIDIKKSGPLGGDAQIAAMVVEGKIDLCIFLIDDLTANPHEADIQMLLRQCRIHNIPVACNRASADFMITSDLWGTEYVATEPKYVHFNR